MKKVLKLCLKALKTGPDLTRIGFVFTTKNIVSMKEHTEMFFVENTNPILVRSGPVLRAFRHSLRTFFINSSSYERFPVKLRDFDYCSHA
jgi:hypothetical protein